MTDNFLQLVTEIRLASGWNFYNFAYYPTEISSISIGPRVMLDVKKVDSNGHIAPSPYTETIVIRFDRTSSTDVAQRHYETPTVVSKAELLEYIWQTIKPVERGYDAIFCEFSNQIYRRDQEQ